MDHKTQTITGENFTVTIHKPILTDSERTKREQEAIKALERYGKAIEKEKTKDSGEGTAEDPAAAKT